MSWLSKCFRQGFCNLGGPALETFDARALARRWKEIGAELVFMDAIHQTETLYPTALSLHAPHLQGRDLVKEFTDACQELGLRAGAYITPFEHTPFTKDHPEWCQTRTDGGEHPGQTWWPHNYWGCWNSPMLDRMVALLEECYGRYPLEAAFFDGLLSRHGVCHCPACRTRFQADTGRELPSRHDLADPVFRAYLAWKNHTLAEACRRLVRAVRVRNPEVQVVSNTPAAWCNWCAVQPEEFFDATEFACCEIFPGFMDLKRPGFIHPSSVGTMAYLLAYTRGQSRGFPKVVGYNYLGNVNYSLDLDVALEAKSTIAMGGLLCVAGYRPGLQEAFAAVKAMEPYMTDVVPLGHVALLASQDSCNTQHDPDSMGEAFFEDLNGTFQALLDNKVAAEFIRGGELEAARPLGRYAVLWLSDVGYLTARQAEAIRAFVRAGGGLVATYRSSLVGEDGKLREDFALADVLGVHAAAEPADWEAVGNYMQDPSRGALCFETKKPWWGDAAQRVLGPESEAAAGHVPWVASGRGHVLTSPFQAVQVTGKARVRATIRSHADPRKPPLPGIVENRYGRGRVIYIALRLGETYARYPFLLGRRLVATALRRVAPRPAPVQVRAPLCVSAFAWEQPAQGRWVIHLLNDLDETGRPRGRMAYGKNDLYGSCPRTRTMPVRNIQLTIRRPRASRAYLPLDGVELKLRTVKDGFRVRLPRLDQHNMLVIE